LEGIAVCVDSGSWDRVLRLDFIDRAVCTGFAVCIGLAVGNEADADADADTVAVVVCMAETDLIDETDDELEADADADDVEVARLGSTALHV